MMAKIDILITWLWAWAHGRPYSKKPHKVCSHCLKKVWVWDWQGSYNFSGNEKMGRPAYFLCRDCAAQDHIVEHTRQMWLKYITDVYP